MGRAKRQAGSEHRLTSTVGGLRLYGVPPNDRVGELLQEVWFKFMASIDSVIFMMNTWAL